VTVLEPVMRALTFYLDVSGDCVRRIVAVDGTVEAICRRVSNTDLMDASSRDLAIQCIKVRKHNRAATQHGATGSKGQSVPPRRPPHRRKPQALELISSRDASVTYTSGALPACLNFIVTGRDFVFKDALISAMAVVSRCCGCAPPAMPALPHARAFHPPHTARPASRLETSDDYLSPCVTRHLQASIGRHVALQHDIHIAEIHPAQNQPDDRVDQIADQTAHNRGERRADNDTNGQVHDIAFGDKVFEFLDHSHFPLFAL
jgi:hypothetical protein